VIKTAEKLLQAAETKTWTPEDALQYERLDNIITEGMLKAERTISKKVTTTYHWSPTLKAAISTLTYWKLRLSQLKGKAITHHSLTKLFKHTNLSLTMTQPLSLEAVVGYIRDARATLRDIQKNHVELRSKHLEDLANAIIIYRRQRKSIRKKKATGNKADYKEGSTHPHA